MKMMNPALIVAAACAALLTVVHTAGAAQLYYESFTEDSLPTGFLGTTPDNGGDWVASQNTPNDQIVAGSLDATGTLALPTAGGKVQFNQDDNTRGTSVLTGGGVGADNTTVYASFLIDLAGSAASFTGLEFRIGSGNTNAGRPVRIGAYSNDFIVGTDGGSGSVSFSESDASDIAHFIVLQFNFVAGDDTVDVFIDPTLAALQANTSDGQLTDRDFAFDRIGLANFNNNPTFGFVDEIRIGTTLADVADVAVIPEPASLGLLGFGGLVMLGRRRRA